MPNDTVPLANPYESPATWNTRNLRLLILDDEYYAEQICARLIPLLGLHVSKGLVQLQSSISGQASVPAASLYWIDHGFEIVSLTNLVDALACFGSRFDMMILDIDFSKQDKIWQGFSKDSSHLGGMLLGIAYADHGETVLHVFTGQDSAMRRQNNADYYFLAEIQRLRKPALGSLHIEHHKVLPTVVQEVITRWYSEVLPKLEPNSIELLKFINLLTSGGGPADAVVGFSKIIVGSEGFIPNVKTSLCQVLRSEQRAHIAKHLSRTICGHQLVRRTFCTLEAHFGALTPEQARLVLVAPASHIEWHENLKTACLLFDVDYAAFLKTLISDVYNNCKSFTRVNVGEAITGQSINASVLFGLFEHIDVWKSLLKDELSALLCCKDAPCIPTVVAKNVDIDGNDVNPLESPPTTSWGRIISISGNRTDSNYFSSNGGSWQALVNTLKLGVIASEVRLSGPVGCVDMRTGIVVNGTQPCSLVTLEIVVHHTPVLPKLDRA